MKRQSDSKAAELVKDFYQKFPARTWTKGSIIVHAGDQPAGVYYIEKGAIRQYVISEQGDEVVVNLFRSPAFVPMSWAISDQPNRFFYDTSEDSVLRCAPKSEVVNFIRDNQVVMLNLLERLYSGLDGMLLRMVLLMSGSAYARIVHELLIQAKRANIAHADANIMLDIKEYQLGSYCGLTRETISREMTELKRKKLVEVSRKGILIVSLRSLEAELGESI